MRLVAATLVMGLVAVPAAFAAETHASLESARQQIEKADYRASGHLVRVDPSGTRTSYPIRFKAHWFTGVLKVLVEVSPASGANAKSAQALHFLAEMRPDGTSSIHIAHPGDAAAAVLAASHWEDGVNGTGFSFEDFLDSELFWPDQQVTEHVKFGARDCDLVKSSPGAADKTRYSGVSSWLDRATSFPVYQEKTVKGSGAVKEYTAYGLRHDGGVWSATQIEEKNRGQGGSTLLIIDRGSAKANLGPADFATDRLAHF